METFEVLQPVIDSSNFVYTNDGFITYTTPWPDEDFYFDLGNGERVLMTPQIGSSDSQGKFYQFAPASWKNYTGWKADIRVRFYQPVQSLEITLLDLGALLPTEWYDGPPPSVGWWPASINQRKEVLRWWNGIEWSYPVDQFIGMDEVVHCAELASNVQERIQWTHRPSSWPMKSHT